MSSLWGELKGGRVPHFGIGGYRAADYDEDPDPPHMFATEEDALAWVSKHDRRPLTDAEQRERDQWLAAWRDDNERWRAANDGTK